MAMHLNTSCTRAAIFPLQKQKQIYRLAFFITKSTEKRKPTGKKSSTIRVLNGGDSYLDMWTKAVDRERKELEFQKLMQNVAGNDTGGGEEKESPEVLERKSSEFQKLLDVSTEERDRVQRMQMIDRAAAAIAAARALLKENRNRPNKANSGELELGRNRVAKSESGGDLGDQIEGKNNGGLVVSSSVTVGNITPGPNFWSWTPPPDSDIDDGDSKLMSARGSSQYSTDISPIKEKEQSIDFLSIPFESKLLEWNQNTLLPPFQSMMEGEKSEVSGATRERPSLEKEHELGVQFSAHAAEAAHALDTVDEESSQGVNPDGSRWWRETGTEKRPDGIVCRWTLMRGVSADKAVEWEEKYWEAADEFDYKELGSEKSGRDSHGNVWHEFWKETMWQDCGLLHMEKTANKWGKNGKGDEWQEKWWEHYSGSGQADKWAHKWCSIDPNTHLEAGHAHVWHERWGEKYDGQGGSVKYTDKWAERCEGDGWAKWGDKWDEHFDLNGHGVKQGETWWAGNHGERWNRTWGEQHNGSGWVHKYGKSSSGEHWDTHVEQDTWYERFPHYGFYHCFENSVQLREVRKPSE